MQTVETLNEGLKRGYTLKITAKDIDKRVDAELKPDTEKKLIAFLDNFSKSFT